MDKSVGYTVKDIITPVEEAICWTPRESDSESLSQEAVKIGVTFLPVKQHGRIVGTVRHDCLNEKDIEPLTSDWLVAADTPILHLIELFANNPNRIFFVLQSSKIIGLVAPADINKVAARASLYMLTANFEAGLAHLIHEHFGDDEEGLSKRLPPDRLEKLRKEQADARKRDINLGLAHYLYLTDLTSIVAGDAGLRERFGVKSKSAALKKLSISTLRNAVSHLTSRVVITANDLKVLNDQCDRLVECSECLRESVQKV
ncbi:MAG: hypothetical protein IPO91_32035 [Chloroflexi bacterium]|nr:hypothetical protein [Chloroflexota bacterium]